MTPISASRKHSSADLKSIPSLRNPPKKPYTNNPRSLFCTLLEEEGHSIILAANGRDGVAIAESHPFDAIVLDVTLPYLDGFSVARRLRRARNQTPILMLTARDAADDVIEGLNLGVDAYLVKPFSFEVLLARLHAVSR